MFLFETEVKNLDHNGELYKSGNYIRTMLLHQAKDFPLPCIEEYGKLDEMDTTMRWIGD